MLSNSKCKKILGQVQEEEVEATSNLHGFIELLIEIDKEQKNDDRHNSINNSKR